MLPEKARLISMLLTALVAGVVMMVNLDARNADWGITDATVREHGWPLVYLVRQDVAARFSERPNKAIPFRWPWAAGENEQTTFSSINLTTDIIVGISIVLIAYMMAHTVLRQLMSRRP